MYQRKLHTAPPGYRVIYARYIRHARTGRIIYPRHARAFRFIVPVSKN